MGLNKKQKEAHNIIEQLEQFLLEKINIAQQTYNLHKKILVDSDEERHNLYKPKTISIELRPDNPEKWKIEVKCGWPGMYSNYCIEGDKKVILEFLNNKFIIKRLQREVKAVEDYMSYFPYSYAKDYMNLKKTEFQGIIKIATEVNVQ